MPINVTMVRQRVPMIDAATLDDRTRPVLDDSGWLAARLRYQQWFSRSSRAYRAPSQQVRRSEARLRRS